jgi:peptide deformylase
LGEKIMVKIVTTPNLVLSKIAEPVKKIDKDIKKILDNMVVALNTAKDPIGVGLAAPQIGIPLQIFITKPTPSSNVQFFINPKILELKDEITEPEIAEKRKEAPVKLEGCLSIPNIWGEVKRKSIVTLSYVDENGIKTKKTFRGLMATIVQHEVDHLKGVLFPKHVLEQEGILYKSTKDEKGEDVFEEINI